MEIEVFEQNLTSFLSFLREAESNYNAALEKEEEANQKTQDILHACELCPELLLNKNVVDLLHRVRKERRAAKKELTITEIFWQWTKANPKVFNTLSQKLGDIRREIRRQPSLQYRMKTSIISKKNDWIMREDEVHQFSLFEKEYFNKIQEANNEG